MESKNNNNIIVTVLLVIIIIGLLGFILYDKVLKKNIDTNNTTSNVEENNNKEEIQKEISVVDAVNYEYSNYANDEDNIEYNPKFNIRLPKIEGNTKTIEELNKQILNDTLPATNMFTQGFYYQDEQKPERAYTNGAKVTYTYKIQNNVVIINVFDEVPEDTVMAGTIWESYLYDIENDKIVAVNEVVQKLGLEDEYNELKKSNPEEESIYAIQIDGNKLKVVSFY